MPRVNQIYQVQSLFIGPAPSSGYHFLSGISGILNNDSHIASGNYNLLKSIQRVQSANYAFNIEYSDVRELGKRGTVYQPIINHPSVSLAFDYINCSVLNELRLGFNANFYNENGGQEYYSNNFGQSLISGLVSRDIRQISSFPFWPRYMMDKRNLFIIVGGQQGVDVNKTGLNFSDPSNSTYSVYSFGDGYLSSYSARGSIGSFPTSSVSFVCENMEVWASGSGIQIPALNPQTRTYANSNKFVIPSNFDVTGQPSTFVPGDINLSFYSTPKITEVLAMYGTGVSDGSEDSDIVDLTAKFSDIKVQNYEIELNLLRKPLYSLGYKIPVDRPIVFPIFATLNTSFIVGDNQTGRLMDLISKNNDYNVTISMRNPAFSRKLGIGMQYDFLRAKLNNLSIDSSIGPSKIVNLGFTTELDPDDLTKGLFISGRLVLQTGTAGQSSSSDYLLTSDVV